MPDYINVNVRILEQCVIVTTYTIHLLQCHVKFCKPIWNLKDTHMLTLHMRIYEYIGQGYV
jgi:hypothetical protein